MYCILIDFNQKFIRKKEEKTVLLDKSNVLFSFILQTYLEQG